MVRQPPNKLALKDIVIILKQDCMLTVNIRAETFTLVMVLAVLYTLRVVAGAAAVGLALSSWLMAFSVFVFVSLAYLKRYIEVAALSEDVDKAHGRGYGFSPRWIFPLPIPLSG